MEKNIERLIAQKKQPVKKFNNNPPKKEVPGPNNFRVEPKTKKKPANDESSDSDSESNHHVGNLKGQLHPNLAVAFGINSMVAPSTNQNHQQQFQNYQTRKMYNS